MVDDLNDYDVSADEIFNPKKGNPTTSSQNVPPTKPKGLDLGLEEVQVVKKRAPIAKLDEERLLSQNGIPKLRRITKERLKFKGKGHEYSDVARLLNLYQLWLDDLYPRAKFADGLAMIEKLGHSKRMQVMRKQWIDEGKPRNRLADYEDKIERGQGKEAHSSNPHADTNMQDPVAQPNAERRDGVAPARKQATNGEESLFVTDDEGDNHDLEPQDDELDALLAEDAEKEILDAGISKHTKPLEKPATDSRDDFADEMEAMEGLDFEW